MVYDAVRQEVKRLTPSKYSERGEDIIVLLHSRPMDHLRIAKLRFRLTDGQIVPAGELDEERALRLASYMFLQPEVEREYTTLGWFYWAPSQEFDVLALDCRDSGEITIHELAHAFTAYDTNTEERERIAENVVESLCGNEEFMARMHESALTPHLSAPAPVSLEEYISNT
jgi:hypothetical protein